MFVRVPHLLVVISAPALLETVCSPGRGLSGRRGILSRAVLCSAGPPRRLSPTSSCTP